MIDLLAKPVAVGELVVLCVLGVRCAKRLNYFLGL
jgi:hypothetical protein